MQPRSPSKLICCTSADDNILMLFTQLTNSLHVRIFKSSEGEQFFLKKKKKHHGTDGTAPKI